MNLSKPRSVLSRRAMTRVEVFVVMVVLAMVVSLFLPGLLPARSKNKDFHRTKCLSQLKALSLAARMWGGDHGDRVPWEVSTNQGGTLELVESTNVWVHWFAMRRELETPRILVCPNDREHQPASGSFTTNRPQPTSYAMNLTATLAQTNSVLFTDRNLVREGLRLRAGIHVITKLSRLSWDSDIHRSVGNYVSTDHSVYRATSEDLQNAFRNSYIATNRLLIP